MSAAIALIFLAEAAAATCTPPDTNRLRAGASVVQAIVTVDPESEPAEPTTAAIDDQADGDQISDTPEAQEPEADQPAEQCPAVEFPIA